MKFAGILPGSPYVCMVANTHGSKRKNGSWEQPKDELQHHYQHLWLVERLMFITESTQIRSHVYFSFWIALKIYSHIRQYI